MRRVLLALLTLAMVFSATDVTAQQGQWQPRLSLYSGQFYSIRFMSKDVVLAHDQGGVLRSEDGGRSWSWAVNGVLADIDVAGDGLHAWAVGGKGRILATADGGRTWSPQPSGTDMDLSQVAAFDAQTALAVGIPARNSDVGYFDNPPHVLLRTDDGGLTWREVPFPQQYLPGALTVLRGGNRAWLAAQLCTPSTNPSMLGTCTWEPAFFRSNDRGQSWEKIASSPEPWPITFVTANEGWGLENNALERTEDGGKSWRTVQDRWSKEGIDAFQLSVLDERTVVLLEVPQNDSSKSQVLETTDAGATWSKVGRSGERPLALVYFDKDHAVRSDWDQPLSWSEDGGETWHPGTTPVFANRVGLAFDFVGSTGWFAGSKLLRTRDAGLSWEAISDLQPLALEFVSATEGWAVESRGGTTDYYLVHSVNGGVTWEDQTSFSADGLPAITFADALNGWVQRGQSPQYPLLHTRDGGKTWQEQRPPGSTIDFVDANVAWVAGSQQMLDGSHVIGLSVSQDGGESWSPAGTVEDPEGCGPGMLAASDAQHAWVLSYDCIGRLRPTTYRTSDGGAHWQALPPTGMGDSIGEFHLLSFFTPLEGVAIRAVCSETEINVPCEEVLVRTDDGGDTWSKEPTVFQGLYFENFLFSDPWHGWSVETKGGGMTDVGSQVLYAYVGAPQARSSVLMPTVGQGSGEDRTLALVVALGALGVFLVSLGRSARWRRRRPQGIGQAEDIDDGQPTLVH